MDARFPEFTERAPWWGADLQTIRNAVVRLRRIAIAPTRLALPLDDGTGDALAAALHLPAGTRADGVVPSLGSGEALRPHSAPPLALLVHGLGGDEDSPYMHSTATALLARGYPVVRLNLRGAGRSRPLCGAEYHAGRTEDLRKAMSAIGDGYGSGFVLVGYSLGANMVLKLAGESARASGLRAVVAVSAPIDLAAASKRFLARRNRPYHSMLLRRLKQESLAPSARRNERERAMIRGIRNIYEFDERVTAPRNGYRSAEHYYAENAAVGFLDRIRVPALLIHAADDPWIPVDAYRELRLADHPKLDLLLSRGGGHLGFHGRGAALPWHDRCLVQWLGRVLGCGESDDPIRGAATPSGAGC